MNPRLDVRALRAAALAACLTATLCAVAAAQRADAQSPSAPTGGQEASVRQQASISGRATRHVRRGSRVRVRGRITPAVAGRTVRIQLRVRRRWRTVDVARTTADGRFRASWRARLPGSYRLRVAFRGDARTAAASRTLRGRVYVYRPSLASWYGPGFYGRRTACGQIVTPAKLGVANKWLPCGTRVTFRYRGRSVTVPVIDRGPYVGAREWDLTAATKRRLRFGSTGTVWATR